jgi:glycogen debranching enzyme
VAEAAIRRYKRVTGYALRSLTDGRSSDRTISEVFDAEPPFAPRGCIAQAWSVAEVLRCLEKTAVERE